jgi:nucleotidyltransferase AbiEii toxin of type IV toxin-antitoxin system
LDFGIVLDAVSRFLDERGYRHAVIGGVALAVYGLPRTTVDLDLVVESSAQEDLISFLETMGYQTLHRSTGYSNHRHSDLRWGNLDFVYLKSETADEIFSACRRAKGPRDLPILLPKPEHLAALKVVAMKNDPSRVPQDMVDIRFLLTLPGVDRYEIREYFERQGMGDRFDDLEKKS